MTGQCPACWALTGVEWIMGPLAMGDSLTPGVVAVAPDHNRPQVPTGPQCIGSGLPLERVA